MQQVNAALLNGKDSMCFTDNEKSILFDQYKIYVDTMEKLVARRQTAHTTFIAANSLLVTSAGLFIRKDMSVLSGTENLALLGISVSGFCLALIWFKLCRSFGQLCAAKFKVIHTMEKTLPVAIFLAEWTSLGKGKDPTKYTSMAKTESFVSVTFILVYSGVLFFTLLR